MAAWVSAHEAVIIGIIWMLVLGPAVGNYACSVVYRLPRGRTPFECHPFCGHCRRDLKPIDLFPVLSWCLTRGRCRYCSGPIPGIYTVIELACGVVFIGYFLAFGVDERFLLFAVFAVFAIILAAIQWQQGWVSVSIYSYALLAVALARTLIEHSIYGWVQGAVVMLVLCLAWQRLAVALTRQAFRPFDTPWIWWMVLLGALTPLTLWPLLTLPAAMLVGFRLLPARGRAMALWPIVAVALYLPVLLY